ncbi:AraC family transcriptional regulator [Variovorax sp. J2P1-59]|uniref:helix-turn-helix domain-containing protein n=1 Tax=Variovorax flavidus TaxID=3053501 RepID=UPI002576F218|nr:AraC family transcriptional regulator [Variovorax sp. J2P1-59]MDM0075471.1 AraC family transcriptional regulator [Variovorax sp. J2P1-59]
MTTPTPQPVPLMEAYKPSPALASCVTDLWVWEIPSELARSEGGALTLLPDGHPTMCFVYGHPLTASDGRQAFTTRSAVCGFQARPVQVSCDGYAAGITVRFRPWSLARFFPPSLEEAAERRVDCRDVFARGEIEDLESQLSELATPLARVRQVERFLLAQLRAREADRLVERTVMHLCDRRDDMSIAQMAREFGATERTLERRFRRAIGVPPKLFARVMRLQAALTAPEPPDRWSDFALECGYYDQSHLNREAKAIFGTSPPSMLKAPESQLAQGFQNLARETALSTRIFR